MLCALAGIEKRTLPSMLGVLGVFSALDVPPSLLKRPTHMREPTVAKISPPTVLSLAVLLQTDKQAELLWCAPSTRRERTSQAQPAAAACLVCTGSESGCATSGGDPAPQPPSLHRQSPERLMRSQSSGAVSQVQGTTNGTSRHILTGPDSS